MNLKKYLASISYDGSSFYGFTKSIGKANIQEEIEKVLVSISNNENVFNPNIKCASRTDAGVHAIGQLILFLLPDNAIPSFKLVNIINSRLTPFVKFNWIIQVKEDFDLFSHILNKEYAYILSRKPLSPFTERYFFYYNHEIDLDKLRNVFKLFEGEHDFSIFSKESKRYKSTICNLEVADVQYLKEKELIVFYLKGNRFLYNMVRRLVGFALLASKINKTPKEFEDYFSPPYSKLTTQKVPSNGLYLLRVNLIP